MCIGLKTLNLIKSYILTSSKSSSNNIYSNYSVDVRIYQGTPTRTIDKKKIIFKFSLIQYILMLIWHHLIIVELKTKKKFYVEYC